MRPPKVTLPRTSDGFQKKLDAMNRAGIKTRKDAYKYAILMLESIKFEMARLEDHKDNQLVAGLLEHYQPIKERWEKNVEYIKGII